MRIDPYTPPFVDHCCVATVASNRGGDEIDGHENAGIEIAGRTDMHFQSTPIS